MEKKSKMSGKKKLLVVGAALVVIGGGAGLVVHNQKVQAEKIELAEKKEKADYKKLSLQVDDSVKKAYDTRNAKDIEMAETIIKKLKEQDQKDPKAKMTKLHSFLDLIKKTDQLLATAEKSKKDSDIKAAQKSIDSEKDAYLAKDKKAQQTRLDKLKKSIEEQKKKEAENKKKAAEDKAKQEADLKREASTTDSKTAAVTPEKTNKEATNATPAAEAVNQEAGAESAQVPDSQPSPNNQAAGSVTPDYSNPNTGGGSTGGNTVQPTPSPTPTPTPNPTPTPTPTPTPDPEPTPDPVPSQKWIGWWNDGTQLHQTGGTYNTQAEALAAAEALYDANGMVGTYGASQL
ncbi:hypothetical protein NE691_11580 [Enterococcus faecalis]|uniref:hypothetical protein n=1 Tax=Enterococcus faecalis TaxID=1351 RepID=UPI00210980F5|nr:hypothetical protein [Enterococcus faecalis]MCQ4859168.1 hypothetical protein [Enterococcus faecalis]